MNEIRSKGIELIKQRADLARSKYLIKELIINV